MDHATATDLLTDFVAGGLAGARRAELEEHLGHCETCRAWVGTYLLLAESLGRLPSAPELTPVAGKAALLLGDAAALERVVATGEGPELAYILEAAGTLMPAESNLALLAHAIAAAPASTAALAIAQLFPHLKADPAATRLLLSKLGDPELGGAAALALANAGTPQALVGLREAANSGEGLAASRAQTALGMGLQYGEADQ